MRREHLLRIGLVFVLLLLGWLSWQWSHVVTPDPATTTEVQAFRAWFWERRNLDLLAQAGLLFVGALGIAALMPEYDEDPL
ncbi:MAG TPA: hypothetical protein ENN14_02370 [Chloroflexi bacterium]|nr:hypothetical protein [Chloroflexota bacterium]